MCQCNNCNCADAVSYQKGEKGDPGAAGADGSSGVGDIELLTGATKTVASTDSGTLYILDRADGIAITIPSDPADAFWVEFEVKTDVTSNSYSITLTNGSGTELLAGFLFGKKASTADERFLPDLSNDVIISMNGSTTGGLRGTAFRMVYDKPNVRWYVSGQFYGSGSLATPFS